MRPHTRTRESNKPNKVFHGLSNQQMGNKLQKEVPDPRPPAKPDTMINDQLFSKLKLVGFRNKLQREVSIQDLLLDMIPYQTTNSLKTSSSFYSGLIQIPCLLTKTNNYINNHKHKNTVSEAYRHHKVPRE